MELNARAWRLCDEVAAHAQELRCEVSQCESGARLVDCGVRAAGGLELGRRLAEVCMAGLGRVAIVPARVELGGGLAVLTTTDHPVAACMAAQYAGWRVTGQKFFAMASGPMRAAAGREEIFDAIGHREKPDVAVGVLESSKLPPPEVCSEIAEKCGVAPTELTLLVARTASIAGTIQIVARSVETALHKLHELGFDLARVVSGAGTAPLPAVAADDLAGIGRTNDAILYGSEVTLWLRGDDDSLESLGPQTPSSASRDHGRPFSEIFERYGGDFYQIDPLLFSPAVVRLVNLDTGRSFKYGRLEPNVLRQSGAFD
jgi:methenyltetrahydromethanopterin cyclohydrolase